MKKDKVEELRKIKQIETCAKLSMTLTETAQVLGVGTETVKNLCMTHHGQSYTKYAASRRGTLKMSLRRKLVNEALSGNDKALMFAVQSLGGLMKEETAQALALKEREVAVKESMVSLEKELLSDALLDNLVGGIDYELD